MLFELKKEDIDGTFIFMTAKEIAKEAGCSAESVQRHVHENLIDGYKFGKNLFFKPKDAEKYLNLYKSGVLHGGKRRGGDADVR